MQQRIRILGLDPGLRRTGWGVIAVEGTKLSYLGCGVVTSDGDRCLALRLKQLHDSLTRVVSEWDPDEVAVEETFVNRDPQSALKLGHARAIALVVPALAGLPVAEYAANLVKKTVVGAGHADKAQVLAMIRVLLPKADPRTPDLGGHASTTEFTDEVISRVRTKIDIWSSLGTTV